jgi:hypothetical protein
MNVGQGIGLWLHGVIMSNFHHLGVLGGVFAISGREANFLNAFSHLHLDADNQPVAKAGIALTGNVEINSVRDSGFSSWPTAIALSDSGGGTISSVFVHGHNQVIPFVFHNSWVHLDAVHSSNEDADQTFEANVRVTGTSTLAITGGRFERYVNAGPAIELDGGAAVTLTAPMIQMHRDAKEVIQVLAPPKRRVLVLNGAVTPDVPWTTIADAVTVLP